MTGIELTIKLVSDFGDHCLWHYEHFKKILDSIKF